MERVINHHSITSIVTIIVIFLLNTANAQSYRSDLQLNAENLFRAPFISASNTNLNSQNLLQNAEKDIVFIENLGQIRDVKGKKRPDVLFLTRSQGIDMYITRSGITYVFRKIEGDINDRNKATDIKSNYYRLDMEFAGMNKNINIKKELVVEQQFNYYTPGYTNGISPKAYKRITIENVYDRIDLVYYEKEGKMKYDFVVKAGADPNKIKMKYEGASSVFVDKDGSLIITTPMGEIKEEKPYTYLRNTGKKIESNYKVKNNVVKFELEGYETSEDIIIDPYRIWATYYGGGGDWTFDEGFSICTDNSGNLYVTGQAGSSTFPTQTLQGAYNQTTYGGGGRDAFILKFNSSGARIWATFYGGSSQDRGYSICTDNSGNLYVTGNTHSIDFPIQTLQGAYNQTTYGGGGEDIFILKFNSSCARIWATFYGGSGNDRGYSICTDNSGNLYVTGETGSTNFPTKTLPGAYNQTTHGGSGDVFILKFDSSCARLWATFYGGSGSDGIEAGIYKDNSGDLYVTGSTLSTNFPTQTLEGAYNDTTLDYVDVFILKFDSNCARIWATYYGGSDYEYGKSICTDNSGNLYVTGWTESTNFPTQTLTGAYNQTTYGGGYYDAFILKFNSNNARIWATYYGGNSYDWGYDICTNNSGSFYVVGYTGSTNFPTQTLPGTYNQTTSGGGKDVFILKFNSNCARQWATYYGGSAVDWGAYMCIYNSSDLYITGSTQGGSFPLKTLPGAYNQTTYGGGERDVFILRFNLITNIKKISNEISVKYLLYQNYPNPFNSATNITFDLHEPSQTKLIVFNTLGEKITTLIDKKLRVGSYEFGWDASGYPSGVYFYKLMADDFIDVKKMLFIK